jgi:hypothetical protein
VRKCRGPARSERTRTTFVRAVVVVVRASPIVSCLSRTDTSGALYENVYSGLKAEADDQKPNHFYQLCTFSDSVS